MPGSWIIWPLTSISIGPELERKIILSNRRSSPRLRKDWRSAGLPRVCLLISPLKTAKEPELISWTNYQPTQLVCLITLFKCPLNDFICSLVQEVVAPNADEYCVTPVISQWQVYSPNFFGFLRTLLYAEVRSQCGHKWGPKWVETWFVFLKKKGLNRCAEAFSPSHYQATNCTCAWTLPTF